MDIYWYKLVKFGAIWTKGCPHIISSVGKICRSCSLIQYLSWCIFKERNIRVSKFKKGCKKTPRHPFWRPHMWSLCVARSTGPHELSPNGSKILELRLEERLCWIQPLKYKEFIVKVFFNESALNSLITISKRGCQAW